MNINYISPCLLFYASFNSFSHMIGKKERSLLTHFVCALMQSLFRNPFIGRPIDQERQEFGEQHKQSMNWWATLVLHGSSVCQVTWVYKDWSEVLKHFTRDWVSRSAFKSLEWGVISAWVTSSDQTVLQRPMAGRWCALVQTWANKAPGMALLTYRQAD